MKLSFDSIEEVKDFVKGLKNPRGGKGGDADDAGQQSGTNNNPPPLLNPPTGSAFNPGASGAFNPGAGNAFSAPVVSPEVTRIITCIDALISSGQQPADAILTWFRGQCGAEAASATLDQIKTVFLPKASPPTLENIVKLIGA